MSVLRFELFRTMDLPRSNAGGSRDDERRTCERLCVSCSRTPKRRWNTALLKGLAVLFVGMQLLMMQIALVHLEDFSNDTNPTSMVSNPRSNPLESFRQGIHADAGQGYLDLIRNHQYQHHQHTHHQSPPQISPKQQGHALPTNREVIHVVHTRFMQHQGNMTTLGVARLKQFLAFCLPTMIHQTTQNFLWIIKVDPLLEDHPESRSKVLQPLLEAVRDHPNIYVVASNFNFNMEGHGGSWRDGHEGEELLLQNTTTVTDEQFPTGARVYTGNMTEWKRAYDLREHLPVLETRLDADDGLNLQYLERVQTIALDRFLGPEDPKGRASPPKPQWLYWCILTQIEWHSEIYSNVEDTNNNTTASMADAANPDYWELRNIKKTFYGNPTNGYVVPIANENFCITPGLTVGYGVGTPYETVPRYMHTSLFPSLHNKFKFCHDEDNKAKPHKGPCLEQMGGNHKVIHALRSRALTSAGMDGVGNSDAAPGGTTNTTATNTSDSKDDNDDDEETKKTEATIWKVLAHYFAIDLSEVRRTQKFLADHRADIALENILGQCSTGHSCKDKAKERLRKIAQEQSNNATHNR